jgi:Protein of unknown function (DUF3619)
MKTTSRITDRRVIEARLGTWLAAGLTSRARDVPHDIGERLRVARHQAVARAREVRHVVPASTPAGFIVGVSSSGAAVLGGVVSWWQRAAAVLPLLVLLSGLVAIDHWQSREQVMAAADIDAQLLADDLPPAAYSDPGFAEFLRNGPEP